MPLKVHIVPRIVASEQISQLPAVLTSLLHICRHSAQGYGPYISRRTFDVMCIPFDLIHIPFHSMCSHCNYRYFVISDRGSQTLLVASQPSMQAICISIMTTLNGSPCSCTVHCLQSCGTIRICAPCRTLHRTFLWLRHTYIYIYIYIFCYIKYTGTLKEARGNKLQEAKKSP